MADVQDLMGQMLENIVSARRANPPPTGEERRGALQEYQNAVRTAGVDARAPWQVMMAGGAQAQRPLDANSIVPGMFKALEDWGNTQRESVAKREMLATKAMYDDIVARQKESGMGSIGSLRNLMGPQGYEPRKNADGTTTVFSRATGQPVGTYGPQDIGKITSLTQTLAKAAFEKGDYATLDEATAWAEGEAMRQVSRANAALGNRNAPLSGNVGGVPSVGGGATAAPEIISDNAVQTPTGPEVVDQSTPGFSFDVSGLSPEDKELLKRLISRYRANPNPGTQQATLKAIESLLGSGGLKQAETTPPPQMLKKDLPKAKMQESQAESVGKDLAKEGTMLNDAMSASNKMIMQLDLLDRLYSTPNMPEGELGPLLQQLRSGLKSLGVDVGKEVGAADMARSIASNFALHLRTGEGQNLLPGAMSNYEDKLLQQMAPVLSLTNEGRLALSQFMKEMAKTNARFGHEFNKMTDDRGIVSPEWRKRKERVMKEEMARIAEVNREIMKRFQGAQ